MCKTEFAGRLSHLTLVAESLQPMRAILIYKKSLHVLITVLSKFERKKRVEVIAHGNALNITSRGMFHLHIDTRSDGQPILTIGISHSSHLRYDLLDFRILILYFHLVQPTLKFRLCPGILHHFPCLNRPLFRNTLQLHIAGYLIHHADQS